MIVLVAAVAVLLVLWLQRRSGLDPLEDLRTDHRPDEKLVDPDEVFHLELTLQNTGRRFILFARLEEFLPKAFDVRSTDVPVCPVRDTMDGGLKVSFTTWLQPRQEVRFRIPVSVRARGFYPLSPLRLSTGDFLGLRERQARRLNQLRAVVAAPREAQDVRVADVLGGFLGDVSVRRFIHEDPTLTAGFRDYTGREPMKQISWTQSAKGRGLMVKVFDHTAQPQVSVLLNADSKAKDRRALLETCCSLARTVCRILEERGIQYDFATNAELVRSVGCPSGAVGEGLGTSHFAAVLDCLGRAAYGVTAGGDAFLAGASDPGAVRGRILITPSDDFAASRALERLREFSGGNLLVLRADETV